MNSILVVLGFVVVATAQFPLTRTIGYPIFDRQFGGGLIGGGILGGDIYSRPWYPITNIYGDRWNTLNTDCDCTSCCGRNAIFGRGVFDTCDCATCIGLAYTKCNCPCCKDCSTIGFQNLPLYYGGVLDKCNCHCCGLPIGKCNCPCCKGCSAIGFYGRGWTGGDYTPNTFLNPIWRTIYGGRF